MGNYRPRTAESVRAIQADYAAGIRLSDIAERHGFRSVHGLRKYLIGLRDRRQRIVDPVRAAALRAEGHTFAAIASIYGVSPPAILFAIRRHQRAQQ